MKPSITGATAVAAVVGRPVRHSLSPLIHNAWLEEAQINGTYIALNATPDGLPALIAGLRGGVMRGFNVTVPFKEQVLSLADDISARAGAAGAANLLVFAEDGRILADNTDGVGLLAAFALQAPDFQLSASPTVILGAGGAARGAAAAFIAAGAPEIRMINRSVERIQGIADILGERIQPFSWGNADAALDGAGALINATTLGLEGGQPLQLDLSILPRTAVVMDMVYRPLHTPLLVRARADGHPIVDGLEMLIGQARPSFEAFFGRPPPRAVDVRALVLSALGSHP